MTKVSGKEQCGLEWIHRWASAQIHSLKRRRKYGVPQGADFSPQEVRWGCIMSQLKAAVEEALGVIRGGRQT